MFKFLTMVVFGVVAGDAFIESKPHTLDQQKALLAEHKKVVCNFFTWAVIETENGLESPDTQNEKAEYWFKGERPEASSASSFATYSLARQNKDYAFYYHMNSQTGVVRIVDKASGVIAESQLDLSDLGKPEATVGQVSLVRRVYKNAVTHPDPEVFGKVPGWKIIQNWGICKKKKSASI